MRQCRIKQRARKTIHVWQECSPDEALRTLAGAVVERAVLDLKAMLDCGMLTRSHLAEESQSWPEGALLGLPDRQKYDHSYHTPWERKELVRFFLPGGGLGLMLTLLGHPTSSQAVRRKLGFK